MSLLSSTNQKEQQCQRITRIRQKRDQKQHIFAVSHTDESAWHRYSPPTYADLGSSHCDTLGRSDKSGSAMDTSSSCSTPDAASTIREAV